MLYQSQEEKPIILVVSEPGLVISNLTLEFLSENSLPTKLIYLDESFFTQELLENLIESKVYKIILIFGIRLRNPALYQKVFDFFTLLGKTQNEKIPTILISTVSTTLNILDNFYLGYQKDVEEKQRFLEDFYDQFPGSLVFLAQDLLTNQNDFDYPLLLFFAAFKQNYLCDPQANFYFQDELSFFALIKQHLIKPHLSANFIVRGKVVHSTKLLEKISYLYEQYFQKKLPIIRLFSDFKKLDFFQEFSLVSNTKSQIDGLLDQRIRLLSSANKLLSSIELSQLNLQKV